MTGSIDVSVARSGNSNRRPLRLAREKEKKNSDMKNFIYNQYGEDR